MRAVYMRRRWESRSPCTSDSECSGGTCTAALSSVTTNVTVLPCNLDINAQAPTAVALTLTGARDDETSFSASRNISCWDNFNLDSSLVPLPPEFATLKSRPAQVGRC